MGYKVENFTKGLIDSVEAKSLTAGTFSKVLDWLASGDKIELVRGTNVIGDEDTSGGGGIYGLHTASNVNGVDVLFRVISDGSLQYLDSDADEWKAVTTDGSTAITLTAGEYTTFWNFTSEAGNFVYLNNPKDGFYKIVVANPNIGIALYDSSVNFKGYIAIINNACYLWGKEEDKTGQYRSHIDAGDNYTTVSGESVGASGSKTYTGTLAFKAGDQDRTCFGVLIEENSGETFTDNYDGTLTGDAGGTGTINYATGEYSVTFNATTSGAVTTDYQWENSNSDGMTDFTYSDPRVASEGNLLRQDYGGDPIQAVANYNTYDYSFKKRSTYRVQYETDDSAATNRIYRSNVGIPNIWSYVSVGRGIYFVDERQDSEKTIRLLRVSDQSTEVIPVDIAINLDLSDYEFDKSFMISFEKFILCFCRTSDSTPNNRVLIYDTDYKNWSVIEWYADCAAIYNGNLIIGDSLSDNCFTVFSGLDNDEFAYQSVAELSNDLMGSDDMKMVGEACFEGYIGVDQEIIVEANYDNSGWEEIGIITGSGDHVDTGQSIFIGSLVVGSATVGGSSSGNITGYPYYKRFSVRSPKFKKVKIRFRTEKLGYASVSMYEFNKVRRSRENIPRKYQ